jgi:hypothetical protein
MWPNDKLPHPWCENTVSHHGVDLAAPNSITLRTNLKVLIKYYRSNDIQTATSFKILNDVTVCTLLDP